jgi:hypothetical protein
MWQIIGTALDSACDATAVVFGVTPIGGAVILGVGLAMGGVIIYEIVAGK